MLFYLDNWQSVGPNSELALYGPRRRIARAPLCAFPASATASQEAAPAA